MNVLILGDPHIGKSLSVGKTGIGSNLNSRLVDQINLLDWTLERAVDLCAEHIIVTGDIFEDPKTHPNIITLFISWLKSCQDAGITIHLIFGNHDIFRSGFIYNSPLDIITKADLKNIFVYKDIDTVFLGGTAFTMMPFRDRKSFGVDSNAKAIEMLQSSLVYELAGIPVTYPRVVVGHFAIEGSIPVGDEIDDISNELFCPISMFKGYDYVWMGHVHKPQVMSKSPYVAHIGSMDISNFGETDHKKIIVVYNTNSNSFTTEVLPTRQLKKITINIPKDTQDTTQFIIDSLNSENDDLNKSIVKVEISLLDTDLKSVNKQVLEKYLTSKGVFNVSNISESKKIAQVKKDSDKSTIDTKMDVNSAIKSYAKDYIDPNKQNDFINLALEIYKEIEN